MNDHSELLKQLSGIGDEHLDQLVKDAKKLRAVTKSSSIPQSLKDSLVRKYDRLGEGQTTSITIKPEICCTFTVKAHRDWEEVSCVANLVNSNDVRAAALFKLLDLRCYEWEHHDLCQLEPYLDEMVADEKLVRKSWDDDYQHLSSEFGVNAYDLVEELKKETP